MERLNKTFPTEVKTNGTGRDFRGIISTDSVDRDGDVVFPNGVDLKHFWKNAAVLLNHDSQKLPIARVPEGGIDKFRDRLEATAMMLPRPESLPTNIEWQPDTILDLFKSGAPLSFSIGFTIKDGGSRGATSKDVRRFGKGARRIITDWELLEFSVVTIPANQDAVLVAVEKSKGPVGSFTMGALGVDTKQKVTITHRQQKRRLELSGMPKEGARLRM